MTTNIGALPKGGDKPTSQLLSYHLAQLCIHRRAWQRTASSRSAQNPHIISLFGALSWPRAQLFRVTASDLARWSHLFLDFVLGDRKPKRTNGEKKKMRVPALLGSVHADGSGVDGEWHRMLDALKETERRLLPSRLSKRRDPENRDHLHRGPTARGIQSNHSP
jgi:hypothetical protein